MERNTLVYLIYHGNKTELSLICLGVNNKLKSGKITLMTPNSMIIEADSVRHSFNEDSTRLEFSFVYKNSSLIHLIRLFDELPSPEIRVELFEFNYNFTTGSINSFEIGISLYYTNTKVIDKNEIQNESDRFSMYAKMYTLYHLKYSDLKEIKNINKEVIDLYNNCMYSQNYGKNAEGLFLLEFEESRNLLAKVKRVLDDELPDASHLIAELS